MRIVLVIVTAFIARMVCVDAQNLKQTRLYEDNNFQVSENITYQLDSVYSYTTSDNYWSLYSKINYSYKDSFLLNAFTKIYNELNWLNKKQEIYSYSEDNSNWSKEELNWNEDANEWKQIRKREFSVNEESGKIDILYSEKDTDEKWNSIWQQSQFYNQSGKLLSYQTIKWNSENSKWESYWDYNCYYDDNNKLLQTTHKSYNEETQTWGDEWECINDYESEKLISEQIIDWSNENDEWNSLQMIDLSYPDENTVIKIKKNWSNEVEDWLYSSRTTELYDNEEKLSESQTDYWDNNTQTWVSQRYDIYSYNDAGIKIGQETAYWNSSISSWNNYLKKEYYYSQLLYPEDDPIDGSELLIYPNPAESEIYLKFTGTAKSLNVYTIQGKKVLQLNNPLMGQSVNVDRLKNGVYIAVISYESGEAKCKFVKK
ncbi:T9SS type A sorting domain-containing protein [Carboxylicivirga linearis]|uniref:T9SS type A sorting domain-containing protein n=1 Tax=Carboxylicivirga linearis TaxID=1628157 RepID=A0ABS5K0C4_9BACT|nr:T9SS type A sorting domain-containing protein [Carboxylicivirga linearis]MBS2100593.1 T9SS type A sorting domain-containing protein [Carboxylicivirga linearis]